MYNAIICEVFFLKVRICFLKSSGVKFKLLTIKLLVFALKEKKVKSGQATYIAPLQPPILALFPAWGSSEGAGRIRLARCKSRTIFLINANTLKKKIFFIQQLHYLWP